MSAPSIARVPHVHAEVIKAWADGEQIQMRTSPDKEWVDMTLVYPHWDTAEYRVKPEKVYPVTQMTQEELDHVWCATKGNSSAAMRAVANAALRHAIDANQIITMADHQAGLVTLGENLRGIEIARHADRDMAIATAVRSACYSLAVVNLADIIAKVRP